MEAWRLIAESEDLRMSECASEGEFNEKWERNSRIVGAGMEATEHAPCPFCAEPDFMVHLITDTGEAYAQGGAVCRHCRRGLRRW